MPVPKRKRSKQRRDKRHANNAIAFDFPPEGSYKRAFIKPKKEKIAVETPVVDQPEAVAETAEQ